MSEGEMVDEGQSPTLANRLSGSSHEEQQSASDGARASGGSRLLQILGAISRVATGGLSGIPDRGRPSFVTGLGSGARAGLAANEQQQAIKFKSFDDQVRLAELHNQDIKLQNDNQA